MPTTLGFKDILDTPEWYPAALAPGNIVGGVATASDLRNNEDRDPFIYALISNTTLGKYNVKNDDWITLASPGLTATGAGNAAIFVPSGGPYGTIAAGATNTTFTLTTALPAAVGVNQLANRGDGRGFKIRIIGNSAGSSGLTEEKYIIANSGGANPTIELDSALTFVPALGDTYEFLSGAVFVLCDAATGANSWKKYDIATNNYTAGLSVVNLLNPIATHTLMFAMDEQYVPSTRAPSDGFFGNLVATASAAASITGQAAGGDAAVLANEYRNFQIRIVTDVATPSRR
jgi:hypothetical protein